MLGSLVRRYADFDAAEDAVQEALLAAALRWARDGVPDNPRGWLLTTASRRLIDHWRSERSRRAREAVVTEAVAESPAAQAPPTDAAATLSTEGDDTLSLFFMCCHPALSPGSAIPLTLRALGGLTTAEIARAFLVPEATMAQRISRAKQRIRASGQGFRPPDRQMRDNRLRSVLHVLYLLFNEGYAASSGDDLQRAELTAEAIRLARMLHRLLPEDPEVGGLLALMLLTDARRPARTDGNGDLIPLPQQDRSRWDAALITEGVALLDAAMARRAVGEYQLQAAIAALHDTAGSAEATDWPQILALYGLLERMTRNPVVTLNRAVAAAMADGAAAGLAVLESAGETLASHHRYLAVRAHLREMGGETGAAVADFREAAARTTSVAEQRYLTAQVARLCAADAPGQRDAGAEPHS